MHLYEALKDRVDDWKARGYACEPYPAIAEILAWAAAPEGPGFRLRQPQVRALETYWYLRLVEKTPKVPELYERLYPQIDKRLEAMGIPDHAFMDLHYDAGAVPGAILHNDAWVKEHRLEALRETFTLDYPSYILALAMGAGKTILIGAIVATEFAMDHEYREQGAFIQNALVFATGKTIIESLRQLAGVRYDRILPPRLYKPFQADLKLTFTRDGDPHIPVVGGSIHNLVVTNTEKIRITKASVRKADLGASLALFGNEDKAKEEVANARLRAIAQLSHLGIFSDEAHHTYGKALDAELKRVRQTVDYLARETSVMCVINTTGTPYYQRQMLRDVVVWYGLSQGIRDGILKEVGGEIRAYDLDAGNATAFVEEVVRDFMADYGDLRLPNGAMAKLALYFPQTDDLGELCPVVEAALARAGYPPTVVLRNTSESTQDEVDAFNRLNDPASPHRVILLVNKGTEGWDCPSLFACALARKLKSSNNFVLQAASRCLRQVEGNRKPARIYLSMDNRAVLERQLQETYGESLSDLDGSAAQHRSLRLVLRKVDVPPLCVRQILRRVVPVERDLEPLRLRLPQVAEETALTGARYDLSPDMLGETRLVQVGSLRVEQASATLDVYTVAADLARTYRLGVWEVYDQLRALYPGQVPAAHLAPLAQQIEAQRCQYTVVEEAVDRATT